MANELDPGSLREQLAAQYRHVEQTGLNELSSGNLSVRCGDGMLISPSGATADSIAAVNIVEVSASGEWKGRHRPSSEWRMHAAIYTRHAAAQAVVHTHSDHCVALASHGRALPGFHYLVGTFGGDDVPCIPYATFGTAQLAEDAAAALTHRTACLLGNHGMIARGKSLQEAVEHAHRLEILCRQYLLARQMGEPAHLTAAEWEAFFRQFQASGYGQGSSAR